MSNKQGNPLRRLFTKLVLVTASTLTALIVAEIVLRFLPSPGFETWGTELFCKDPVVRRLMKPNRQGIQLGLDFDDIAIASNSQGYRDTEWSEKTGAVRIMLLGDSFVFGWGCRFEATFGRLIDRSESIAVYNLGIPGDGFKDYYYRYSIYRQSVKPDFVLMAVYVNDLFDRKLQVDPSILPSPDTIAAAHLSHGVFTPECIPYDTGSIRAHLNRSYVFRRINALRISSGIVSNSAGTPEQLIAGYSNDVRYLRRESKDLERAFEYLSHVLDMLQRDGASPLLVYIPPPYGVDESDLMELIKVFGDEANGFSPEIVEENLQLITQRKSVPFLSLSRALRRTDTRSAAHELYFPADGHLNEQGHAVAARAIEEFIQAAVSLDQNARLASEPPTFGLALEAGKEL